jgi:hypothetical protein
MEVVRQRWIAWVGNRASESVPLATAKRAAVAMLRERGKVEEGIADLNRIAAAGVDRAGMMHHRSTCHGRWLGRWITRRCGMRSGALVGYLSLEVFEFCDSFATNFVS